MFEFISIMQIYNCATCLQCGGGGLRMHSLFEHSTLEKKTIDNNKIKTNETKKSHNHLGRAITM